MTSVFFIIKEQKMTSFLQCTLVVVSQRTHFPLLVAHVFECHLHNNEMRCSVFKELIQEKRREEKRPENRILRHSTCEGCCGGHGHKYFSLLTRTSTILNAHPVLQARQEDLMVQCIEGSD